MDFMLNKEEVIQKMEERGFSKVSHATQGEDIVEIRFATKFLEDSVTICCSVDLIKGEFKLQYAIPCSINFLSTPSCSSFMNDKHFDNLFKKISIQAALLDDFFDN